MSEEILKQILATVEKATKEQVAGQMTAQDAPKTNNYSDRDVTVKASTNITEYVGSEIGDTVGIVIANLDSHLHGRIGLDTKYRAIGVVSSRTGGGPHVMAADEAVKATNTEIVSIEFARDTKGGAGHGCTIIFAAEDVSDARRAVEVMLANLTLTFGDVYGCDAGHIELHYTARASHALNKAFNAPIGKSFGITVGAPAAVGLLMADVALKTANVEVITYASPAKGTCFSNEIIVTFTGDSGAVRQALVSAREIGLGVLKNMGQNPTSVTRPVL